MCTTRLGQHSSMLIAGLRHLHSVMLGYNRAIHLYANVLCCCLARTKAESASLGLNNTESDYCRNIFVVERETEWEIEQKLKKRVFTESEREKLLNRLLFACTSICLWNFWAQKMPWREHYGFSSFGSFFASTWVKETFCCTVVGAHWRLLIK